MEPRPAVTRAVGGPVRVGGLGDPSRVPRRLPATDALQGSPSWVVLKKLPEEGRIGAGMALKAGFFPAWPFDILIPREISTLSFEHFPWRGAYKRPV